MCLAIPGEIITVQSDQDAVVSFRGVTKKVHIDLVPDVKVGDYVLIHAGFAIEVLDKNEAIERLSIFEEIEKGNKFE